MRITKEKYDRLIQKLNATNSNKVYLSKVERILIEFALEHYTDDTEYFED